MSRERAGINKHRFLRVLASQSTKIASKLFWLYWTTRRMSLWTFPKICSQWYYKKFRTGVSKKERNLMKGLLLISTLLISSLATAITGIFPCGIDREMDLLVFQNKVTKINCPGELLTTHDNSKPLWKIARLRQTHKRLIRTLLPKASSKAITISNSPIKILFLSRTTLQTWITPNLKLTRTFRVLQNNRL